MSFRVPGALKKLRTTTATTAAKLATTASRATGRGAGGMIGGLIANAIDPSIMTNLGGGRPAVLVTGTNGKSTNSHTLARPWQGDAKLTVRPVNKTGAVKSIWSSCSPYIR